MHSRKPTNLFVGGCQIADKGGTISRTYLKIMKLAKSWKLKAGKHIKM